MQLFKLDPRLAADTYQMGELPGASVLLIRNAHYPWLVLVPHTDETEFHRLSAQAQTLLMTQASHLASFIELHYSVDKINIASIGNMVSQMHLHVVGRHKDDPTWPDVVWGAQAFKAYTAEELRELHLRLLQALGDDFKASELILND